MSLAANGFAASSRIWRPALSSCLLHRAVIYVARVPYGGDFRDWDVADVYEGDLDPFQLLGQPGSEVKGTVRV